MTLNWGPIGAGHYGAAGDGWVYVASRDGRDWILRELPVTPNAQVATRQRFATLADAKWEAADREDAAELLTGRYGLTRLEVAEALAEVRRAPNRPVEIGVPEAQSVRIGRDAGGYTLDVLDRPRVPPHGHYRPEDDKTPRCPSCHEPLVFAYCRRCCWDNGIDVPTSFGTNEPAGIPAAVRVAAQQAGAEFPGTVQVVPLSRSSRSRLAAPARRAASTASGSRQAYIRSPR